MEADDVGMEADVIVLRAVAIEGTNLFFVTLRSSLLFLKVQVLEYE